MGEEREKETSFSEELSVSKVKSGLCYVNLWTIVLIEPKLIGYQTPCCPRPSRFNGLRRSKKVISPLRSEAATICFRRRPFHFSKFFLMPKRYRRVDSTMGVPLSRAGMCSCLPFKVILHTSGRNILNLTTVQFGKI